jgi:hypothetical protein
LDHAELIRRKAKIEALLPLVRPEHVDKLYRRLMRVNAELRLPPESDMPPNDPAASSAGTNGVGGLHFQANAPAGVGRLVRVPLFLSALPTDLTRSSVVTDAGVNQVAAINPVVSVVSDWFAGQPVRTTGMQMRTRVVKFAVLRVVGIKISARFRLQYGFTTTFMAPPLVPFFDRECQQPSLLVKNLVVGGGTNLFPQDDYVDATVYSESVPEFAGLRDYPVLEDPNTCSINVATVALSYGIPASLIPGGAFVAPFGAPAGGSPYVYVGPNPFVGLVRPVTQFSMSLVCEILEDEIVKGVHIPGPYARRDALARLPSPLGMETVR